jgi:hypothetical protein
MRPVRTVAAVMFAAAVAVTGCAAHSTADHPSPTPSPPVVDQAPTPPVDLPAPTPRTPAPTPPVHRVPVLADGHYDAYIRQVDTRRSRLVVDLVQVFHDQAAVSAAIADGMPRAKAQYLYVYVRNHNPRLRTLPLARDLRVEVLRGNDDENGCHGPSVVNKLRLLISDVSFHSPNLYFTLSVTDGAVHNIKEVATQPAC